MIKSKKIT